MNQSKNTNCTDLLYFLNTYYIINTNQSKGINNITRSISSNIKHTLYGFIRVSKQILNRYYKPIKRNLNITIK